MPVPSLSSFVSSKPVDRDRLSSTHVSTVGEGVGDLVTDGFNVVVCVGTRDDL